MPKSFVLTCKKAYYTHFFKTTNNLDYVGSYPEPKYYGVDFISGDERAQFSAWYEGLKKKFFNNMEELFQYLQQGVPNHVPEN